LFLWDGLEHGLGVKITPAGSKVFILQKSVNGRRKRMTLGAHGDVTLDAARKRTRILNGRISDGHDPIAQDRAAREEAERLARSEKTVSDLWDRYVLEIVAVENKPRTAGEKRRMWEKRVKHVIGKMKVKDVSDSDAGAVVRSPLRTDAKGRVIGKGEAGNLYRLLHHMFRKALAWNMRPRELGNPLEIVEQPKVKRRERLLAPGEVTALLRALDQAGEDGVERPHVLAAIKAATLTGARISEILGMRWEYVRKAEKELHLPDTKSGFSRRPLSTDTLAVLEGVERMPGSPFVFRSSDDPASPLSYNVVEKAFRRIAERAGVEDCTLHTLRHCFATMTANNVSNPRVGMMLTGHKSHAAYLNYIHGDTDQAHALTDQLAKVMRGLGEADNTVVKFRVAK
jgi:integrase